MRVCAFDLRVNGFEQVCGFGLRLCVWVCCLLVFYQNSLRVLIPPSPISPPLSPGFATASGAQRRCLAVVQRWNHAEADPRRLRVDILGPGRRAGSWRTGKDPNLWCTQN